MIRPLEFCETSSHIKTSLDTIDHRIEELHALRQQYLDKQQQLTTLQSEQQSGINTVVHAQEIGQVNQLAE